MIPRSRLTVAEAALCARIAGAVPLIWIGIHAMPLPRALAWITPRRATPRATRPERILELADRLLDRRPFGIRPTCLLRSLVLYRFLREADVPVRLHLGIAWEAHTLSGHAWLTHNDRPLLEATDPADRFTVVLAYPPVEHG